MITDLKISYPINRVLGVDDVLDFTVEYSPKDEEVNLTFAADPTSVVKVNNFGQITGVAEGIAIITVTDTISGLTDVANITIVSKDAAYQRILPEINENMTKGFVFAMNTHYGLSNRGKGRT